ncbi:hypothetical protein Moror_13065 [Moniliophthora roreri MCA 2997]|uniref:Uncharacterized protein n=1 Tax=Moniliophthora roreri (strain MCA 2997) TaxID=1381753 RepID=V2XMT5_MONRO|nr:hypothetical protein Moror_13065 [Moniliophthora roreri MCA 2997]
MPTHSGPSPVSISAGFTPRDDKILQDTAGPEWRIEEGIMRSHPSDASGNLKKTETIHGALAPEEHVNIMGAWRRGPVGVR